MIKNLARVDLLILDDWGLTALTQSQRIDLLKILSTLKKLRKRS